MRTPNEKIISSAVIRTVVPILLALALVFSCSYVAIEKLNLFNSGSKLLSGTSEIPAGTDASHGYVSDTIVIDKSPITVSKDEPVSIKSAMIVPGKDFLTDDAYTFDTASKAVEALIDKMFEDRLNTVNVLLNYDGGIICENNFGIAKCSGLLEHIYEYAKTHDMNIALTVDLGALAETHIAHITDIINISTFLSSESVINNCDILILKNFALKNDDISYDEYINSGSRLSYNEYVQSKVTTAISAYYNAVLDADSSLYTGIYIDSHHLVGTTAETLFPADSTVDFIDIVQQKVADFVIVNNSFSTLNSPVGFEDVIDFFDSYNFGETEIYHEVDYKKVGSGASGWTSPDQIVKQLMVLGEKGSSNFLISSYSAFVNDTTESRQAVIKFLSGQISLDYVLTNLNVTSPKKQTYTTYEDRVALIGASDPEFSLTLNGEAVERNKYGYFSLDLDLKLGLNTFTLQHKGSTKTYKITYKKVIIKEYEPTKSTTVSGGSTVTVSMVAISGSTVTAKLNGTEITLKEEVILDINGDVAGEYSKYRGSFTLPHFYDSDKSLGNIVFNVKSKYGNESKTAAKITVEKTEVDLPGETPEGGNYVDVGGGYVAEVTNTQAEVFNIGEPDDWSRPTNNYLPAGTVDHCSASTTSVGGSTLRTLRYGKMLYASNLKVTKTSLPSTNAVEVASFTTGTTHTMLTLNVDWKAPFLFHIGPQNYTNEGDGDNRDYTIKSSTFRYIDITFCYATVVEGDISIPEGNLIFSKAEWIKNTSDHTLRLYLKNTGKFFGWYARYNSEGQLVFEFLNPARITAANNKYGYDLSGVTVMLDAGHGGSDCGALGSNKNFSEAYLNLFLAREIKKELESIGATVIMTRDDDSTLSSSERIAMLRDTKPDYVLAIHRNASGSSSPNGFISYHYNAYSADAAKILYKSYNTFGSDSIFPVSKWSGTKWHPFFLSRTTNAPVVLTENGFITNGKNFDLMIDAKFNKKNAVAMTQGIVDYFKSIQ